ncbi:MAG: cytochrome c [Myxococcota bacterium]
MTAANNTSSDGLNRPAIEREGGEPKELPRGLPMLVAALTGAIGGWGATYLWYEAGDGADLLLGDGRSALVASASPSTAESPPRVNGAAIYAARCVACHQANGAGIAGVFPPLAKSEWVLGDERRIVGIILQGLRGEIEVLGQKYNGVMPAFREILSDAELAAVVSHVRSSWGNSAPPVDPDAVAQLRDKLAGQDWIQGEEGARALAP